jgi:hypothetical protein
MESRIMKHQTHLLRRQKTKSPSNYELLLCKQQKFTKKPNRPSRPVHPREWTGLNLYFDYTYSINNMQAVEKVHINSQNLGIEV